MEKNSVCVVGEGKGAATGAMSYPHCEPIVLFVTSCRALILVWVTVTSVCGLCLPNFK